MTQAVERYGRLDCAFNNAGIIGTIRVLAADYEEAVWDEVLGINLKGVWLCMRAEIPEMLRTGGGASIRASRAASSNRARSASPVA